MGVFIGLDVSLAKTVVCVVDRDGRVLWQGKVPSEPEPLVKRLAEWDDRRRSDEHGHSPPT
jgi:transposase